MSVKPIPQGYRTITPYLTVRGAADAIEFYKRAFGAEELSRMIGPNGMLLHAEIKIGDSIVMLGDELPERNKMTGAQLDAKSSTGLLLYVADVNTAYARAVTAGARVIMPLSDMFWGDRYGKLKDPFGHEWSMATHKEDVGPDEMSRRAMAALSAP